MAQCTIYPNFSGTVNTAAVATYRCRAFNLIVDTGLVTTAPFSLEHYLQDHATGQTIERILEFEIQANVMVLGTDLVGYAAAIALVQSANTFNGMWSSDPTGFVDNLAGDFLDPWAADILTTSPLQYSDTQSGSKILTAHLRSKYTVTKSQWDNGGFTSWPTVGEVMNTLPLVLVHKAGASPMPLSCEVSCWGCLTIRKGIAFNNDTLMGGVF